MSARSAEKRPVMRELVRETVANAILDAAETVAAERGAEGTSIAAIAERAGVAVGTLYNYFPDRDSMLAALFKSRRELFMPRIKAIAGTLTGTTVEQRLQAYLEAVLLVFEDFRTFCRISVIDDGTFARIKGRQRPVLDLVVEAITDIVRPTSGPRAGDHAHMIVASMRELLRLRIEQDAPLVPDAALVTATFVHGLTGKK